MPALLPRRVVIVAFPEAQILDVTGPSPHHFARVFGEQVGLTPARYVEAVRLERARALLEEGDLGIEQIASACGFGTPETMRRSFGRRLSVAPSEYRSRFEQTGTPVAVQGASPEAGDVRRPAHAARTRHAPSPRGARIRDEGGRRR